MIKVGSALIEYAEQLERERGISKELILDSLKEAMVAAYKKYAKLPDVRGLSCRLIEKSGEIGIYEHKLVVSELIAPPEAEATDDAELTVDTVAEGATPVAEDTDTTEAETEEEAPLPLRLQILLADARKIKPDVQIGQDLEIEVTPSGFDRFAAQIAKQVIMQRIREAEKDLIIQEFEAKKHTMVPGMVQRLDGQNVIVNIGRSDALMPKREQLPGEYYRVGNRLRVYVLDVKDTGRIPQIIVSQAHPALVKEVFELEVPEIEDGIVEIKSIAREAGHRTKVAVHSTDPNVDPQGACIGTRGSRIQSIVNEMQNEKIDIIRWSDHPADFIVNALAPARINDIRLDPKPDSRRALVVVPDDQLSLAIGREGQNVRLAAKLTGYKLDIKSMSQFERLRERLIEAQQAKAAAQASAEATTPTDEAFDEAAALHELAHADEAETVSQP
jgi:N utilization substance protein A